MPKRHLRGFPVKKKNVHACARLVGEMAHTYAHLPPNTAHACARLTLVCAHASNHGFGGPATWSGRGPRSIPEATALTGPRTHAHTHGGKGLQGNEARRQHGPGMLEADRLEDRRERGLEHVRGVQ